MNSNIFLNKRFLKIADKVSFQNVMSYYDFYDEAQWWPIEKQISYQNKKLSSLIATAYAEIPLYRDVFRKNGLYPKDIKTVSDLHKVPVTTKQALKSAYPTKCTRKSKWPVKEYFTSGSSGNPFAVLMDRVCLSQARALMLLRANYGGWNIGYPLLQTGMSLDRGILKKLKDILFGVCYVSAFDLSDHSLKRFLELILKNKIRFIMGYPGSIYALALLAEKLNSNISLDGIITWGDNLYDHFRKKVESQFGCRVTDTYGCGEGIQVAAQCPEGYGGYHVFMPHVVVEVVDDYGNPVRRGEMGHILLTRLEPGAMPFIRYKVGDIGRLSKNGMCACGRGYDLLEKIEGRDSDFICTPSGNKLIVHFFTGIFEYFPQIKEFRVVQTQIDKLQIFIVPEQNFDQKILLSIEKEIKAKGDSSLDIVFKIIEKIENKNGKRKFVISSIN